MKKKDNLHFRIVVFMLFLMSLSVATMAQKTFYRENFGSPTANTLIQNFSGWQDDTVIYTGDGTCDIRTSSASSGYAGASGGGNVMINDTVKWFQISKINTLSATQMFLYCGLRKTTTENGSNFVVEVSSDSVTWSRLLLKDTLPSGTGTSGWYRVCYPNVPVCENLHIRFSNLARVDYRLDDIALLDGEETVLETVAKPSFSKSQGTYYDPFWLEMSCETPEAKIYYTVDGSTPTEQSLFYKDAILIDTQMTVKAMAVKENMNNSDVVTATYIVQDTNAVLILPFDISDNSKEKHQDITLIPGFRAYNLGSSYSDGSVKFETAKAGKAALVAQLDSAPEKLSFELKGKNGGSNPSAYENVTMEVAESADGKQWKTISTLTEEDISVDDFTAFQDYDLSEDTRYIRWLLSTATKGNTQLNNIRITKREETPIDSTAITTYEDVAFCAYPNPTDGAVTLYDGGLQIQNLSLCDLTGKELKRWSGEVRNVSLSGLPLGTYILKVYTPKGMYVKKLVKY